MELLWQIMKMEEHKLKAPKNAKKQSQVKIQRFEVPMMALSRKKKVANFTDNSLCFVSNRKPL